MNRISTRCTRARVGIRLVILVLALTQGVAPEAFAWAGSLVAVLEAASVAKPLGARASSRKEIIVEGIRAGMPAQCSSTQATVKVRSRSRAIADNAMHGLSSRQVSTRQVPKLQADHRRRQVPRKAVYFAERPAELAWVR